MRQVRRGGAADDRHTSDDPYALLAAIYDDWQERYGRFTDGVLEKLAPRLRARPPRAVLDLGCGTGNLLLALAPQVPATTRLAGVDGSAAMLAVARAKPDATRIEWWCGDIGAALFSQLNGTFDLIGAHFNTLNHLPDLAALHRTFCSVERLLAPGGAFQFDLNSEEGYRRWWSGTRQYGGGHWTLQVVARFDARAGCAEAALHVNVGGQSGRAVVRQRLFTEDEVRAALRAAGLEATELQPWSPLSDGVQGASWWSVEPGGKNTRDRARASAGVAAGAG